MEEALEGALENIVVDSVEGRAEASVWVRTVAEGEVVRFVLSRHSVRFKLHLMWRERVASIVLGRKRRSAASSDGPSGRSGIGRWEFSRTSWMCRNQQRRDHTIAKPRWASIGIVLRSWRLFEGMRHC